ncbi:hypothetical protein M947_04450 [Sulfurimonas hongkongensis]|uniref:Ferrous iron transporter FeoA-like domain-containing protein n=1 Tax=Sulfurimonas hongkongensis TaxID=1172190 RepID=T0L200_9BACT|nr:FeoA family protein [Sulfurimonas hongkongensis]EQB39833.1 hypothetical protein M947_04450 [Sulfurimonas hongkongensis]
MKTLKDCQKSQKVRVVKLHAPKELKQRLISFGIMKDTILQVMEYAPAKSTIKIKIGKMSLALRAKEAEFIEVELI